MKLGISTHVFAYWPLRETHLDIFRDAGFSAVELWAMGPHIEFETPGVLAGWAEAARRRGLEVLSVHLPFYRRFGVPDFRDYHIGDPNRADAFTAKQLAIRTLSDVKDTGARLAVLHGPDEWPEPPLKVRNLFQRDLREVILAAEKEGITLAIENVMTPMSNSGPLAELIREMKHPLVRACLDVGHANVSEDPVKAARRLGDLLVTTHVHDNHGDKDEHLVPGHGTIDWPALVEALTVSADPNFVIEINGPTIGPDIDEKVFSETIFEAREVARKLLKQ